MASKKGIALEIPKWNDYASRSDIKNHTWFKCSNRILEDEDFFEFTDSEILCWIYILSLCSQKKSDSVFISFERAKRFARREPADLVAAIEKLKTLGIVKESVRDPYAIRTGPVRNPCTTGQESTGQESTPSVPAGGPPPSPKKRKGIYATAEEYRQSFPIDTVTKGCAEFTEARFEEMVRKCFEYHNLDEQKIPTTKGEWNKRWFNWCETERAKRKASPADKEPLKVVPSV